jgi:hypothetical protein
VSNDPFARAIAHIARRADWQGTYWHCISKTSKKRLVLGASIASLLLSAQCGNAYAADPYEGEWKGRATATKDNRCKPADVTLTILGNQATGQAKFELDARNIHGIVRQDG